MIYRIAVGLLLIVALGAGGRAQAQDACPTAAPRLAVGGQGRVTPGDANRLRAEASTSAALLGALPGGTSFVVVGGPVCGEGYRWWQVKAGGMTGWTVEGDRRAYFLDPVLPEVTAPAVRQPSAMWGYGQPIDVAWSASGLAVGSTVGVWQYADPAATPTLLPGSAGSVKAVAFNPAGDRLVVSLNGGLHLYDVAANTPVTTLTADGSTLFGLEFNNDGSRLMALGGGRVYVWDVTSGDQIAALSLESVRLSNAALSPDGQQVFTASADGTLRLWDVATGQPTGSDYRYTLLGGQDKIRVTAVAFAPDGTRVAAGDDIGNLRLWPVGGGAALEYERPYRGDPATPMVVDMLFLPDGRLVTGESSASGGIRRWSVDGTITLEAEIDLPNFGAALALALAPDGQTVAARFWNEGAQRIALVTVETWEEQAALAQFAPSTTLALSGDGHYLLTEGADSLLVYDTGDGSVVYTLTYPSTYVTGLSASTDGTLYAACVNDNLFSYEPVVMVWSPLESNAGYAVFDSFEVTCQQTFFRDHDLYFFAPQGVFGRPERDSSSFVPLLPIEGAYTSRAALTDDALAFVLADRGAFIYELWNPAADPLILPWAEHESYVAFGAAPVALDAANTLAARRSGPGAAQVDIYALDGAAPELQITLPTDSTVTALAFSPDGRWLMTGHQSGRIYQWDWANGAVTMALEGTAGEITALAFSPDGTRLYSVGKDSVVRVWEMQP